MPFPESTQNRIISALGDTNVGTEVYKRIDGQAAPTNKVNNGATPAVVHRFGLSETEGYEYVVIDEVVTVTNAVETNLTNTVPAGAVILAVQGNLQTAITGDGTGDDLGAKVGIGITATPNKYGLSADLNKNTKVDKIPSYAVLGSAETVCVKFAKTDGTACTEKFTAGGKVRVRVVYVQLNSLDDA